MRLVSVKSRDQQAALSMHRARDLLVKQRTQVVNMMRGLLAEFGIDIPKGLKRALMMARQIVDGAAPDVPPEAVKIIGTLSQQALDLHVRLREIDRDLLVWQRSSDVARRLMTIPGIGPVGATAFAATVGSPTRHGLISTMGPSSRTPSGPAVQKSTASTGRTEDCTRPTPLHHSTLATREPSTEDGRLATPPAAHRRAPERSPSPSPWAGPRRSGSQCRARR